MTTKRILRPKDAWGRLRIGRQTFYERFIATGRLRVFAIGPRARGILEADVDALIDELASAQRPTPRPAQRRRTG